MPACLQGRVGGRPYSERMLGQIICMTKWLHEQRAILGFSDKGAANTPYLLLLTWCLRRVPCLHATWFHAAQERLHCSCTCPVHAAWKRARQMRFDPELKDPRAIMLLAYQHQEPPMRLPKRISGAPSPLMAAMREAIKAGLEIWQVRAASRLPQ